MKGIKRWRFAPLRAALTCGREFCRQTSMDGFVHIAAPGRWWGERVLWACATVAAIWGAVEISLGQWQRYNENPTVVALEKDFRSWEFCMPGLTLCAMNRVDEKKLPAVIKKYWGVEAEDEAYGRYAHFVRDVANSSMLHLQDLLQHEGEDLEVDLYQLAVDCQSRHPKQTLSHTQYTSLVIIRLAIILFATVVGLVGVLPEMNLKATWSITSHVPWFPVMTEMGACYSTNSLAIPDDAIVKPNVNDTKMFPLTCKYSSLNCYITIEVPEPTIFYIHSPYDILNIRATAFEVRPGAERPTELSVMESGCGRGVRELSPRRRSCLYTDEPVAPGRQVYSTNSCRRSCRNQEALRDCQCKPFYNHYGDGAACSLRGMRCLAQSAARATSEAAREKATKRARAKAIPDNKDPNTEDAEVKTDVCTCPLMCVDALFEILSLVTKRLNGPFGTNGVSRIKIQAPRTRYTREIVFYFQDLIVSFGGAAGLFLGASFISFVEIVFFAVEWLVGCPTLHQEKSPVKKVKISHEQTRIQNLNAILEDHRQLDLPEYWHSLRH